ncbi:hypothetical protein BDV93DRAFT_549101 [Ceratobasidium sp. AG-I]|nr:hypothetical protein BDV93DRAFT_549101 [Ceratobasidium sp. AG-I]
MSFRSGNLAAEKSSNEPDQANPIASPSQDEIPAKPYSPLKMRAKVLKQVKRHASGDDIDRITASTITRYFDQNTLLIRFNLQGALGNVEGCLMLYGRSNGLADIDDQPMGLLSEPRRAYMRALESSTVPGFLGKILAPEPGYFNIMEADQADHRITKLKRQRQSIQQEERGSIKLLSLDKIVILATTISSRIQTTGDRAGGAFLDEMWKGLLQLNGEHPNQHSSGPSVLITEFGKELLKFRHEMLHIQEKSDPNGNLREEKHKIRAEEMNQRHQNIVRKKKDKKDLDDEHERLKADLEKRKKERETPVARHYMGLTLAVKASSSTVGLRTDTCPM